MDPTLPHHPPAPPLAQAQSPDLGAPASPSPVPQLPPQMFTTAASLLELTDKKLIVILRDGRKLIGVLRSWDQFGNLVLLDTIERLFVRATASASTSTSAPSATPTQHLYADSPQGVFLVRGENILLMGEIDLDRDEHIPAPYVEAPLGVVHAALKAQKERGKKDDARRQRALRKLGFEGERSGEVVL